MIARPPAWFGEIRERAVRRWRQLDADAELAGPWQLLFRQVQSPAHVVSELLQNADDAGARAAEVRVDGKVFTFVHDGRDFTKDDFASLCRFGYSNKRVLHTIGFRGIGFKSTFSLGPVVELRTPTLVVRFREERFTLPEWMNAEAPSDGRTWIQVKIADEHRRRELLASLETWREHPVSLLFFRNLRRLRVGGEELGWDDAGPGPVPGSERRVEWGTGREVLVLRSEPEAFPPEALEEIRRERLLSKEEALDLPPSTVDLVIGVDPELYVVLPTGVRPNLPFAVNAPFLQDPGRRGIKPPGTSPTNRWLLERAGRFAARAMLAWLGRDGVPLRERARAYALFPSPETSGSPGSPVEEEVVRAFDRVVEGRPFLLDEDGGLHAVGRVAVVDAPVLETWSPSELADFMLAERRPLCRLVERGARSRLLRRGVVVRFGRGDVVARLHRTGIPRPGSATALRRFWAWLVPDLLGYGKKVDPRDLYLFPVTGKKELARARDIVRLSAEVPLEKRDAVDFLQRFVDVLDLPWLEAGEEGEDGEIAKDESGPALLKECELHQASGWPRFVDRAAAALFLRAGAPATGDCVRLARVAARLGVPIGNRFRFLVRDGSLKIPSEVVFETDNEDLVPPSLRDTVLLHPAYEEEPFVACTAEEWRAWVTSRKAGMRAFLAPQRTSRTVWSAEDVRAFMRRWCEEREPRSYYRSTTYRIEDWDFPETFWRHWQQLAEKDPGTWVRIGRAVAVEGVVFLREKRLPRIVHVATNGYERTIWTGTCCPAWLCRFRELECLPDERGNPARPVDLLYPTETTKPFLGTRPFLAPDLCREELLPVLRLLGVQDRPPGARVLLDRLRALAGASRPPVAEVERWYRALDEVLGRCSSEELDEVRKAFREEPLVLDEEKAWRRSDEVFRDRGTGDVPGLPVLREGVRDLALWSRIGVPERPSSKLALRWLGGITRGAKVPAHDLAGIRGTLRWLGARAWEEVGAWLALDGSWQGVEAFRFGWARDDGNPPEADELFPHVLAETADLRMLGGAAAGPPFADLPRLVRRLEYRPEAGGDPGPGAGGRELPWLTALGEELARVVLEDEEETKQVRELALRLARTRLREVEGLRMVPYLDGMPAGPSRAADVAWAGEELLVRPAPPARLAHLVPAELARRFEDPKVRRAIVWAWDRDPEKIRKYVVVNFFPLEELPEGEEEARAVATSTSGTAAGPSRAAPGLSSAGAGEAPGEPAQGEDAGTGAGTTEAGSGAASPVVGPVAAAGTGSADAAGAGSAGEEEASPAESRPERKSAPSREDLARSFFAAQGFEVRGDGGFAFVHPDGRRIGRVEGRESPFRYVEVDREGRVLGWYLPVVARLDRRGFELPAEAMSLLRERPGLHHLVVLGEDDAPRLLSGTRLVEGARAGEFKVVTAVFRVVARRREGEDR